jgi:hypothetical protein
VESAETNSETKDMDADYDAKQVRAWGILLGQIRTALRAFGNENYVGKADYLVVDDNYGFHRHTIEIHKLHMLEPRIIKSLQQLLRGFPDWEIIVAVDIPGKETVWPPMGVTIRENEIIDGLQRRYLPKEFEAIKYEGSRPGTGYN